MAATALDAYYPFDTGSGASSAEDQWRTMARQWLSSGPLVGVGNQMSCYGDSTGMQVKVATGACWVNGHYGSSAGIKTLAIGPNSTGNPRIDTVVAQVDTTGNKVELDVVPGTPGASPVPPTLTQTDAKWQIPLGQVVVGNGVGTITALNVTDVAAKTLVGAAKGKSWNVPWGVVARSADVIVSQSPITTNVDVTGMSCSFTGVAGRRYRAQVVCHTYSGATNSFVSLRLILNAGQIRLAIIPVGRAGLQIVSDFQQDFQATGATALKLQQEWDTASSSGFFASAAAPSYVYVEDIGPV